MKKQVHLLFHLFNKCISNNFPLRHFRGAGHSNEKRVHVQIMPQQTRRDKECRKHFFLPVGLKVWSYLQDADFAVNNVGSKKKKKQETNDPKNRATETGTGQNPCNKRMARSASNEIENPGRKKPKTKKSNPSGSTLKAKTSDSGDNRKPRDKTTKEKTCESVVLESPGSPPFEVESDSDKDFV